MMGKHEKQKNLFSYGIDLDKRIRKNNPLRKVLEVVDFSFVREEVKDKYGSNGHVGLDPEVILKLMFLLFWDNIKSERELVRILSERLDYLWFIGYGIDDEIPDHSVLSKARRRWGQEVFESMFVRSVAQCVEAGMVGKSKMHVDGSLVAANASVNSVVKSDPEMIDRLREVYGAQEAKLEMAKGVTKGKIPENRKLLSSTDPDSACVRKKSGGQSLPRYKVHRAVDDLHGVITATETTPGNVEENAILKPIIEQHERNVGCKPSVAIADSQYGTAENYRNLTAMGVSTHMAPYVKGRRGSLYAIDKFLYDRSRDAYLCPAGNYLNPKTADKIRMGMQYIARKELCNACPLKRECTNSNAGRIVLRRWGQDLIDEGIAASRTRQARSDRKRRMWLMEGSFAQSANLHGFKRSRWRRIWRQRIQDHIIESVQNIKILISRAIEPQNAETVRQCLRFSNNLVHSVVLTAVSLQFTASHEVQPN
ncbi:IS1182 family transposase [Puniceicoccaceae bacterium K14]|nr:IS1182 family transposase [Puniceicoccaceae bacterium K14]